MEAGKQNKLTCRECKVMKKIAAVGAWSQVLKFWSHIPISRLLLKTYTLNQFSKM